MKMAMAMAMVVVILAVVKAQWSAIIAAATDRELAEGTVVLVMAMAADHLAVMEMAAVAKATTKVEMARAAGRVAGRAVA